MQVRTTRVASRLAVPGVLEGLPPFRPVAVKLMSLAAQDDLALKQVSDVLNTDAALAAEVLRLANSALIGSRYEITGLLQAVAMLGIERLKALAMTVGLRDFLRTGTIHPALQLCWRHNLATALTCERLSRLTRLPQDTCYTAGLVHDIGRLALLNAHALKYEHMLTLASENGFDLLARERDRFGLDHCQAGEWLMEEWGLPAELQQVAARHHEKPMPGACDLVTLVHVGWQIAEMIGFSPFRAGCSRNIEEITAALAKTERQLLLADLDKLAAEVALKINAIECSLL